MSKKRVLDTDRVILFPLNKKGFEYICIRLVLVGFFDLSCDLLAVIRPFSCVGVDDSDHLECLR